jgi:hypothetical protein
VYGQKTIPKNKLTFGKITGYGKKESGKTDNYANSQHENKKVYKFIVQV